jgi:hypothetical protein
VFGKVGASLLSAETCSWTEKVFGAKSAPVNATSAHKINAAKAAFCRTDSTRARQELQQALVEPIGLFGRVTWWHNPTKVSISGVADVLAWHIRP